MLRAHLAWHQRASGLVPRSSHACSSPLVALRGQSGAGVSLFTPQTWRLTEAGRGFTSTPASFTSGQPSPASAPEGAVSSGSDSLTAVIKRMIAVGKREKAEKNKEKEADIPKQPFDKVTIRRLMDLVKPEAKPLSIAVGTLAFTSGVSLIFPKAIGEILDVAISPSADSWLTPGTVSAGLLGLFVVQSGMIAVRSALLTTVGERISTVMRTNLFRALLSQETAWFDKARTGDLVNRLSSDTVVVQKSLTTNIANGLRSIAMVAGGTGMLFYMSPSLAALSLALIPPVAVAGISYGRFLAGQQRAVQEALGKTMEVGEEILTGIKTVRAFGREEAEGGRFSAKAWAAFFEARRIGLAAGYFDGGVHLAANIGLIAVLYYGGTQVAASELTAGDLTAFLLYSVYTGLHISSLSTVYTDLKRAVGAAQRIFDVMDRVPAMPLAAGPDPVAPVWAAQREQEQRALQGITSNVKAEAAVAVAPPRPLAFPAVKGDVSFQGIGFAYPTRPDKLILNNFSLDVPAGSSVCLVGRSGSGKSTIGGLLLRMYDPAVGRVLIDGVDVRDMDPRHLRSCIGVVSQDVFLFATSIRDNIRFGRPEASDAEVEAAARAACAHDFISSFPAGYDTLCGERGHQLSGGERQRIGIARALLKDPRVLLLDEATSALPQTTEASILSALREAGKGRTVISCAHRVSTIAAADQVAVVEDGRIVEVGTFPALNAAPASALRKLLENQIDTAPAAQ